MKLLTEELTTVISKELSKPLEEKKIKEFEKLISDMKNAGILKKPNYNLPMVDTIGKNYYSTINKRK